MLEKSLKILAIDDNQDILFTLKAIGETFGWEIYAENDSKMALDRVRKLEPDLILMDYHMPGQDGLSTVRQIRSQNRTVPIIVLTVDERQEVADRFLAAGANDFANKPIKVADLATRIRVHINIRQQQGSYTRDKGINSGTLEIICVCCQKFARPFLAEEVVESSGLAYQTVVRYLQYLEDQRILQTSSHYGKVGRPKKKYQMEGKKNNLRV